MLADLQHGWRSLRRAPGHAATLILTLALGIGATTAMFSVVDAVLLRPLPLFEPARVVVLETRTGPASDGTTRTGSPGLLAAWGERSHAVRAIAALRTVDATLIERGVAERATGLSVSGTFFSLAGMAPLVGRALGPGDAQPGAPAVVLLGERLWRRRFGADPAIVGRVVRLDGVARVVVGVLPASFDGVLGARDFVVPLALEPGQRDNFTPYLTLVGRLAPGATLASAARELDAITARLGARATRDGALPRAVVTRVDRARTADVRRPLWLMLGAIAAVFVIACVNAATLVLVRAVGRAREMAVRAALGAGRGRLVRQLAAEQLVVGALATAAAVVVAVAATRVLVASVPGDVPRIEEARFDGRALALAVVLGLGASVFAALAPALAQRRLALRPALSAGARGSTDRQGEAWRRALVGVEVALALVLLCGAGLFIRSAVALDRVAPGFDVAHVLTARLALPTRDYPQLAGAIRGYAAMRDAARQAPGIVSAGLVSRVPLGGSMTSVDLARADRPVTRATTVNAALRITSADYFRSIGVPLLAGRDLRDADDAAGARVVVVNATLARRLGATSPGMVLGRRVQSDNGAFADSAGRPRLLEIVGVVGDVRDGGPREDVGPEFYAPMAQVPAEPWNYWIDREMVLVARTRGDAAGAAAALRRAVAAVDARVPLYDVQTTAARLAGAVAVERFSTQLLTALGALGLVLAAVGIHGVVAYLAAQRGREVGIRLALGSTPGAAAALVLRQCLRPVGLGLVAGVVGGIGVGRAMTGVLFGVSPSDPASLLGAVALLGTAGAVAAWGPARRTARIDPASAMRAE